MTFPSWLELHAALTHFPIALLVIALAFEGGSLAFVRDEVQRQLWRRAGLVLLGLAVFSALPALLTGYLYGRTLSHPPADFDAHWKVAIASTVLATIALIWRVATRERMKISLRSGALVVLLAGVVAVGYTGRLGGQMVFGDELSSNYVPIAMTPTTPTADTATVAATAQPSKLEGAAGKMEIAAGKLDIASDRLTLAVGAAQAEKAENFATQAAQSARSAEVAAQKTGASRAQEPAKGSTDDVAVARRLEAVAGRYENVADKLSAVADKLASASFPAASTKTVDTAQKPKIGAPEASAAKPVIAVPIAPTTPALNPQLIASGETLFRSEDLSCSSCHRLNGSGGRSGPALDGEGDQHPDVLWQKEHLVNPDSKTPGSKMPPYNDLKADQLEALATYLASLKK